MSVDVISWWYCLCAVGALNILAWSLSARAVRRRQGTLPEVIYRTRRVQLALSAVYVFGCAFRCAFPVYDVPRICLFDHWLSSVIVGRSVATLAELAFVAQWAVMLNEMSRATGSVTGRMTSLAVVPLIAVAETCSWYSVLTTCNLGHVAEESLWGLCVALLVASMISIAPRCAPARRPVLLGWCIAGMVYVAYMVSVDVPMYWARFLADETAGRHYLSLVQGILDVASRRVVSHRWLDWKNEIAWMSLYFSVAVWMSISLMHAPAPASHAVAANRRRAPMMA